MNKHMNKYLKDFLHRGLIFGGFGPIILGIVYAIIESGIDSFSLNGKEVMIAVISTYALAFIQAGASVFNQIEHWPISKALLCHFSTLYVIYTTCYIVNSWIPFKPIVLLIFSAVFAAVYFAIWLTVYICIRATERKLNAKIR